MTGENHSAELDRWVYRASLDFWSNLQKLMEQRGHDPAMALSALLHGALDAVIFAWSFYSIRLAGRGESEVLDIAKDLHEKVLKILCEKARQTVPKGPLVVFTRNKEDVSQE